MNKRFDNPDDLVHAPHPLLTDYYASEEERRGFVRQIFDSTQTIGAPPRLGIHT